MMHFEASGRDHVGIRAGPGRDQAQTQAQAQTHAQTQTYKSSNEAF